MIGSPHRKIKLRKGQKTLDTGYSTDPDSNTVSQSQSPKRSISIDLDKINQSELQTLIEHQDPVYRPFSPVSPAHQDQPEESSVTPQIPLYATSDSEKEPDESKVVSRHAKSQERVEQGKRLASYMKGLRESGYVFKKRQSKSQKSGLIFPVARVLKGLKSRFPNMRVQTKAAVMLAGVLEYVCSELIKISGNVSLEMKRKRINPHQIKKAVNVDSEFEELMENVEMPSAGTLSMIHPELLKTASKRKRSGATPVKQRVQEEEQSEEEQPEEWELEEEQLEEEQLEEGELEKAVVMEPLPKKKRPAGYERAEKWQAAHEEAKKRDTTGREHESRLAQFLRERREAERSAIQDMAKVSQVDASSNKENVPATSQEKTIEATSEHSNEKDTDSDVATSETTCPDMSGRLVKRKPFRLLDNLTH